MVGRDRLSTTDRLVGASLSLLVGAVAVYVAVRLVEAVWEPLAIGAGVLSTAGLALVIVRRRSRGW